MVVTRVSHSCFLIELGPICNSMAASLWLKSCEDHSLLKSYNRGLWKNNYRSGPISYVTGLGPTVVWLLAVRTVVWRLAVRTVVWRLAVRTVVWLLALVSLPRGDLWLWQLLGLGTRITFLLHENNKGTDQSVHPHSLTNAFVIRSLKSTLAKNDTC